VLQLLGIVAMAWASSTPADIPNPRTSNSWVSDTAQVIDAPTQSSMNSRIEQLYQSQGIEIAVVTVVDVAGTPKEFATELFNLWGVGGAKADGGLLILLVMDQRRLEMETGYGLEGVLSDGWLGTMQSREMVPHFKAGDHAQGLEAGLVAIEARLLRSGDLVQTSSDPGGVTAPAWTAALTGLCVVGGGGLLVSLPIFWIWRRRRLERLCPACKVETHVLAESEEDEYLDAGQQSEEDAGDVQWDVRLCPSCRDVRVIDKTPWYRGTVTCEGCGYRTGEVSREVIRAATYTSIGTGRVTRSCSHCDHKTCRTYVISKKVDTSSSSGGYSSGGYSSGGYSSGGGGFSSGGGGGSFGGGSSGGGGAGSSW